MKLGIGVISCNRPHQLSECLDTVKRYTDAAYELVVADDGSDDETKAVIVERSARMITGQNMGVAWNKNRAIYVLSNIFACDVVLLVEEDTFPIRRGWQENWVNASLRFGHVNLAGHWFRRNFVGGSGTVEDPIISRAFSGQVTGFSREAIANVGYLDSRFRGFGGGHVDHTRRMVRAGYGGFVKDAQTLFYLVEGGVVVTQLGGPRKTESAANIQTSKISAGEFWARFPYRTQDEFEQFRSEIKQFSDRPYG
jgi:glycosyltransferase involved in cell wall biosynthesis